MKTVTQGDTGTGYPPERQGHGQRDDPDVIGGPRGQVEGHEDKPDETGGVVGEGDESSLVEASGTLRERERNVWEF